MQAVVGAAPVFYNKLVFDGNAYIVTDIIPPTKGSFVSRFGNESIKGVQRVFFCNAESSTLIGLNYGTGTTSNTRRINYYYGKNGVVLTNKDLNFSVMEYDTFLTPKMIFINDRSYTYNEGSNSAIGFLVLGQHPNPTTTPPYSGTMETFYIYGSNAMDVSSLAGFLDYTPVYTLRPCTYNGEAGMWCVETNRFYGNSAGLGTLTVTD